MPVELANDSVQFELDAKLSAPFPNAEQLLDVFPSTTADEFVGPFVEAVARNTQNVHEFAVLVQPRFCDFGTIGNDRDTFHAEIFLAELTQPAKIMVEERFAAREVDFAHPGFFPAVAVRAPYPLSRRHRRFSRYGSRTHTANYIPYCSENLRRLVWCDLPGDACGG